jgi:penicillin V acylase-like amidase (Ntn superfamily)
MCTAAVYKTKDFYFGRTLDYDCSYGEEVTITPRNFCFRFKNEGIISNHYAIIGMAHVTENYPLYYDAVNEKGLGMAGLNFVGNADYKDIKKDKYNIASFELIPWILSRCSSVKEVKALINYMNITNIPFNNELSPAQLHWIIAGHEEAITLESTKTGIHVYDNKAGILTNNPPFNEQMFNLNNYMSLSAKEPQNNFCSSLMLHTYSRGMGALGLPGDLSSQSRFVRASFVRANSVSGNSEEESVNQFFHILGSVEQQRGCCNLGYGRYEITLYTSCCNTNKGLYYYTTYENHQITEINMHNENLDGSSLITYPLIHNEQIKLQN